MSWSTDENRCFDRRFHSTSNAWHTNLAMSCNQPFDVTRQQAAYACPPTAPCASFDFEPPVSLVRIPNSMPNPAVYSDSSHANCPSMMADKYWCHQPVVTTAPFYAHCTQTVSKPAAVVRSVAPPDATLLAPSVEGSKCRNSIDVNKNCDNTSVSMEYCARLPAADLCKISSTPSCSYTAMEAPPEAIAVACSDKTSSTELKVVACSSNSTGTVTSVSGSDTAVTSGSSSAMPRPKCGRAKTNAELKRQLMERREQRLRDMQDAEITVPSSASSTVLCSLLCKQSEASAVVVS